MDTGNTNSADVTAPTLTAGTGPAPSTGPPKSASDGEGLRGKVYLALVVAVLSFAGGAVGTMMSYRLDESKWRRETTFNVKKETFAKRMELLERTVKDINLLHTLDVYNGSFKYSAIEGEGLIRAGKPVHSSLDTSMAATLKVKEAQAELTAVMTLDIIYFGPKTREAIKELEKALKTAEPWWKVADVKVQAVLDAVAAELDYGLFKPT